MAKTQTSAIGQWRAPLHLWTAVSMGVLLVLATGVVTWRGYVGAETALVSASIESIGHVRDALTEKIRRILELSQAQLAQIAYGELSRADTLKRRIEVLPLMADALKNNDLVDALYAGYPNGEFILFRPLRTDPDRERFDAPATATILIQSITVTSPGVKSGEYRFYDAGLSELEVRREPNYKYDPRERDWYKSAATASRPILTEPYVFYTTHAPGETMARRSVDGQAIIGLDVRLGSLADELHRLNITPSTEMAIVDDGHRVIAYSDLGKSIISTGPETFRLARLDELGAPSLERASALVGAGKVRFRAIVDGRPWQLIAAKIDLYNMPALHLVLAVPDDEFFAAARAIVWHQLRVAVIVLIISVAGVWWVTQRLVKSLRRLVKETTAISRFDFRQDQSIETRISEVSELEGALDSLKRTIRQFLEIGNALAAERDFRPLLERVLREIIGLVKSDGGAIFLLDESGRNLLPSMVRWQSEEVGDQGVSLAPIAMDKPGLFAELVASLQSKQIVTVERHLEGGELDALGLRRFVDEGNFVRVTVVIVPLLNRNNTPLGALTLIKGMQADSKRWKVGDRLADLIRAVSGSASVAIENKQLLEAQKRLMDSLIQLVAGAIDAKSPYTGGHCTRVPALTQMLAEAACEQHDGPFKDFELTEEEWEAVHIASWLHDCGKVTTPEFVVDKATKLETIYDRIHEIRMRFEVLKRDAEIAYWRGLAEGGVAAALQAKLDVERKALDEDFAFIATSNEGGEFMAPERIERVKRIATRQWQRTLSDRIGVSNEEKVRKDRTPEPQLPLMESLLADRDDHILIHETRDVIGTDNQWGFKLTIPKHKYNRGEVYNLCISRGTLTEEERYRINDHIVQTIIMLESLPFPRHLKDVPELAGGHHEKMDGTGYPKGLTRDQMSPVARMMAVADVFEALTAADRPYKKAKKLSEAIKIMGFMKKDRHLDPEILDLFLSAGVWRRYAERFLSPEQIDDPDIEAVLKTQPAASGLAA